MSGIVGLFNLDGRPVALADVHTLAAAAPHRAVDGERFWIGSSFGIGHQHARVTPEALTEEQPLVSASATAIAFDGRLDNRQELTRLFLAHSPGRAVIRSDAALILAAYEQAGESFASQLNGDFAFALFDSQARTLVLARDTLGARRLHYTQAGATLLFASEIKSLLAHPCVATALDEDALAELVLDKWDDGHHTGFKRIYSVPPGQMLVARPGRVELRQHWLFNPARELRYQTLDEYLECFGSLFEQAVRRRMRSVRPVAVSVSGGVDSSSILCQAAALRRRDGSLPAVRGISMTFPAGTEAHEDPFLDDLDGWCGSPVTRLPISELRLIPEAEKIVAHLEMPTLVWDAHRQLFAQARREGCSVILDGYFGDQMLFGRRYLVDLARRGGWLKVRRDLREFAAWMTDADLIFFQQEFRSGLLRSFVPRPAFQAVKRRATRTRTARYASWYRKAFVDRALERQSTRFPSARFASRHAEEYYRHATAGHYHFYFQRQSAAALMHGVELACPFRDRDLVAFMMAIPGEVVNWRGVPKGLLRLALTETLPPSIRDRRWKADFTVVGNQAVLRDYGSIVHLLTRDCLAAQAGFVDGRTIEQSVAAFRTTIAEDDTAIAGWQLGDLVALELWLRHFFGAGMGCTTS